ncbi:MAG: beta-ketoacyl-[acyl-carrier-protein] synthase family protein [Kiritimatiellae bacterium]|nr:beta-ketoacyl-[acyl-carrier-protein] synthase family protein [Kiritimatiellia bacterium]
MNRVVVTGLGAVSALGSSVDALMAGIAAGTSGVKYMEGWSEYKGLRSLVGAPVVLENVKDIPRKQRRSMGRMSIMAVQAANEAIADAGLEQDVITSGRTGCIVGSTMGGAEALYESYKTILAEHDLAELSSMSFFQCVSHTAVMNLTQYLGIKGTVMATSAACASALQAIGAGCDLIRLGKQDVVLCGGAEELHPTVTGSFDILFATSTHFNDKPESASRPFDRDRDGLVCGEGSGIIVLEEYEHAVARGAHIYAELIGYDTSGSGAHISQSDKSSMVRCLKNALADADVQPEDVDYISAHATATIHGDGQEGSAIKEVFPASVPVNSLKGYIGHTLGASGAIELAAVLKMMQNNLVYPTLNLDTVAEECEGINHVRSLLNKELNIVVKNCFAFGGINASLVCRKIK